MGTFVYNEAEVCGLCYLLKETILNVVQWANMWIVLYHTVRRIWNRSWLDYCSYINLHHLLILWLCYLLKETIVNVTLVQRAYVWIGLWGEKCFKKTENERNAQLSTRRWTTHHDTISEIKHIYSKISKTNTITRLMLQQLSSILLFI